MRAFGFVLAGIVAAALAADPAPVERLTPYSVIPAARGGRVRTATAPAPGGPPSSAYYHAVAVPTSGMAVRFSGTAIAAVNPWN